MGKAKSQLINILKVFKSSVTKKYGVEKIILFGSQVTGRTTKDSDVDLIIVTKKNKMRIWPELYHEWHMNLNINYPVDFVCYTPKEFKKLSKGITIVRQALKEGIDI